MSEINSCPFHSTNHINKIDALNEKMRANPWPYYDWLRENEERVYQLPDDKDFYLLHRYDDVREAFLNNKVYRSQLVPTKRGLFLALMDGEEHKKVREVIASMLLPKKLEPYEGKLKQIAEDHAKKLISNKPVDLLSEWAVPIPMKVLALLFDFPQDDKTIRRLHEDTVLINKAIFVTGGTGPRRSENPTFKEKLIISYYLVKSIPMFLKLYRVIGGKAMREIGQMFRPVGAKKLTIPRPNFEQIPYAIKPLLRLVLHFGKKLSSSHKANHIYDELGDNLKKETISKAQAVMLGSFVLFAGHETTTSLLSNSFVHLARNPDDYHRLKNNPDDVEKFIEESLRYYTPIGRFLRRVDKDQKVGRSGLPKDSIAMLMVGAANTDPAKFEKGCVFDMDRKDAARHLSFGKGAHFCVGAQLARLQVRLSLHALLEHTDEINIAEDLPSVMVTDRDNGVYRHEKVYVRVK